MCHWSETVKLKLSSTEDGDMDIVESGQDEEELQIVADNVEVFKALQLDPASVDLFKTFGYHFGIRESSGSLVVGEKFAEGGQAELFHAYITWKNAEFNEECVEAGHKWVLKVFKKGTSLRHLQKQWPRGMLEFRAEMKEVTTLGKALPLQYTCDVMCATLLEDGRFAFLLKREDEDLRTFMDRNMNSRTGRDCGPFEKGRAETIMFRIALGMDWLHSRNIVHRDLKASNVLVTECDSGWKYCVADFECSIGVIGTGFWRAPEILQALKDKNVYGRPELFSKEADVYAYGMTCYEIFTGKLPFENHSSKDYDIVINGQRPKIPKYVDDWICELLRRCWQSNPRTRPSIGEILNVFLAKSRSAREYDESRKEYREQSEKTAENRRKTIEQLDSH